MSGDHFEYKGYLGSALVDIESGTVYGRLLFIPDVIGYSADAPKELEAAFRDAVDDYLDACKAAGDQPQVPCKGSFNVRVGPEKHRQIAVAARQNGVGLNDIVCEAITAYLSAQQVRHVHHHHELTVTMSGQPTTRVVPAGQTVTWENERVTTSH